MVEKAVYRVNKFHLAQTKKKKFHCSLARIDIVTKLFTDTTLLALSVFAAGR